MRAALVTGLGRVELVEQPDVPVTGTRVGLSITLCGVCGTDLGTFRHGTPHSPAVCGHEWVGTVTEVGTGVTTVAVGGRVVVTVPPPCGRCPECAAGLGALCRVAVAVSRGRDPEAPAHGGFAPRLVVDEGRVVAALPELSDVEAAQVEPAAVSLHGVRRTGIDAGDVVAVLGGGPIGLLAAQCARVLGAGTVVVVEPLAPRRALALALGADAACGPDEATALLQDVTGGLGADAVLECTGLPALLATAADLARRGGTVLLLGYSPAEVMVRPGTWLSREITLRGAVAATRDDVVRTMRLIAGGRLQVTPLHTRTVGLADLADVFTTLGTPGSTDLKVLVDPLLGDRR